MAINDDRVFYRETKPMRKVLFATTALVALGGVSAASADISVAGKASHNFVSGSGTGGSPGYVTDSQSMSTTVDFGLSGSNTLDNGMTVAGGIDLDEGGYDDSGWTITGDFGTLAFGGYASDSFGAMSVDVTADEGHGGFTSTTTSTTEYVDTLPGDNYIGHSDISLALPAVSGVSIMIGYGDGTTDDNNSSFGGVSYAMDAGDMTVTVAYAKQSTGGSSAGGSSWGTSSTGASSGVSSDIKPTAYAVDFEPIAQWDLRKVVNFQSP